jgi:hypothetical protein
MMGGGRSLGLSIPAVGSGTYLPGLGIAKSSVNSNTTREVWRKIQPRSRAITPLGGYTLKKCYLIDDESYETEEFFKTYYFQDAILEIRGQ